MLEGLTPPPNKAEYCKIAQIIETLDPSDAKIFQEAVNNTELWGSRTLSTALRTRGVSIADTTITKHRSRGCACYRG
jgi:hypothetical protein